MARRRIDALDSETPRFPLKNVPLVEQRLAEAFDREAAAGLVSSPACVGGPFAFNVAGAREMRRRVVLPSAAIGSV